MTDYRFALYSWRSENESGIGVCYYDKFNNSISCMAECGTHSYEIKMICGFNTAEEAANAVYDHKLYSYPVLVRSMQITIYDFLFNVGQREEAYEYIKKCGGK